jgi:nucleoside 2-deoxyribosyltransferase
MTGIPEYNYPYFNKAAARLRHLGLEVHSPAEIDVPTHLEGPALWEACMELCMELMVGCDSIILLRGWPRSRGAKAELKVALEQDWTVYYYLDPPGRLVNMTRLI